MLRVPLLCVTCKKTCPSYVIVRNAKFEYLYVLNERSLVTIDYVYLKIEVFTIITGK